MKLKELMMRRESLKPSPFENVIRAMFTPVPSYQLDYHAKIAKRRRVSADNGGMIQRDKARKRERRAARNAS